MNTLKELDKIPTGYSDKLTAEHFILGNKLKKQLKGDKKLTPEEQTQIADKLADILSIYKKDISKESGVLSNFSDTIKHNIEEAIKIEKLKTRNYKGYTENDKKVMTELEEKNPEIYKDLILNHGIEFTKDHIIIYYGGKFQYDREDLITPLLRKEKMPIFKAKKLAKKEGKEFTYRLHDLAEEFGNEFIVNLFQLKKDGEYYTGYVDSSLKPVVQSAEKIGKNVPVTSCNGSGWTADTKTVDENYEAYIRLCRKLNKNESRGGSITIID